MRFSEWLEKLDGQQKRLNELALSEVSETISVMGKTISITFGKQKNHCEVDGTGCNPRYLRPLYTNNKEEFDAMLESITEQTDQVVEATDVILASVSDEAIPGAVIARMKGDKIGGDPADLVETMTEKKLLELSRLASDAAPYGTIVTFNAALGEIAEEALSFAYDSHPRIIWGSISVGVGVDGTMNVPDVGRAMFFLANYDLIKARVLAFIDQVKKIS